MMRPAALVLLLLSSLPAQEGEPTLRITSPAAESVVSGTVTLSAVVEPVWAAADVTQITFYVDGRSTCVDTTPEALSVRTLPPAPLASAIS